MHIKSLSPLAKLGIWLGLTCALTTVIQLAAWLVRADFDVIHNSGIVLAMALASLFVLIAADQREVADFGFIVGPVWKKLLFRGVAIGASIHLAFIVAGLLTGVFVFRESAPSAKTLAKGLLNGMTAMPLAATQQILFTGYLLTMLRDRYRAVVAVVISAGLFAVLGRLGRPEQLLEPQTMQMMFCLLLVATLLGLLRLQTGSILTSIGLLAGWVFVRRFIRRGKLLEFDDTALAAWIAPNGDARLSPIFWTLLAGAIGWSLWMLRKHGEQKPELDGPAIDEDFKRVFPLSNGQSLAPLDVWLPRLWEARFRIGGAYIPRMIAVAVMSTVNTVLTLPERLLMPLLLRRQQVKPPVFILGAYRSGTTHLHNILALDPQFCTTRAFHIMNPVGCLFSGWLITPLLGLFLPGKRPMDGVRFHLFSPQEEEFALACNTKMSVYWGITFPQEWPKFERYLLPQQLPAAEQREWRSHYDFFLKKLTFWSNKRPLLKNPCNTGRMDVLSDMYPGAKFIHIRRHPQVVYQSNMHLCRQAHVLSQVQDPVPETSYTTRFVDHHYLAMEQAFAESASTMPANELTEIRFEDLETNPIDVVQQLYQQLELDYTPEFDRKLRAYLQSLEGYKKNRHRQLSTDQRKLVEEKLGSLIHRWGYVLDTSDAKAA